MSESPKNKPSDDAWPPDYLRREPKWTRKQEREFQHVRLQMMPWTRVGQKYAKHLANQLEHIKRPMNLWHKPKRDRPRCGFPCGHPLRSKPCHAPVVVGRAHDGRPIMGRHCRRHGGWT